MIGGGVSGLKVWNVQVHDSQSGAAVEQSSPTSLKHGHHTVVVQLLHNSGKTQFGGVNGS